MAYPDIADEAAINNWLWETPWRKVKEKIIRYKTLIALGTIYATCDL